MALDTLEDYQLLALEKHLTDQGSALSSELLSVLAKVRIAVDQRGLDRDKTYLQDYSRFGVSGGHTRRGRTPSDPKLFPSKKNRKAAAPTDPEAAARGMALLASLGLGQPTPK